MTNNRYEPELKQKVLRLYLEEGRTKKSLTEEYNLGQGTLTYWLQQYRKECDNSPTINFPSFPDTGLFGVSCLTMEIRWSRKVMPIMSLVFSLWFFTAT
ncbi:transposase [Streptococcus lutetiensis]|uniref:transposase n=1 Tax=Streptococcus lutetiensis TaxID=150055 RepID=UPI002670F7D3|nr:transposase [Streptococcus lutetiensis]MDU4903723.1 transposase [Streptococcus lutetiensis]